MTARRVVIVGGVAGGMSTATRLRRLDESASSSVIERSGHVSYANCGLPYFVGGVIEDEDDLLLPDPRAALREVSPRCARRHRGRRDRPSGPQGHRPFPAAGSELLDDAALRQAGLEPRCEPGPTTNPRLRPSAQSFEPSRTPSGWRGRDEQTGEPRWSSAAGFVGLETAENLAHRGIAVTVVEAADQVLTPLDPELAISWPPNSSPMTSQSRRERRSPR